MTLRLSKLLQQVKLSDDSDAVAEASQVEVAAPPRPFEVLRAIIKALPYSFTFSKFSNYDNILVSAMSTFKSLRVVSKEVQRLTEEAYPATHARLANSVAKKMLGAADTRLPAMLAGVFGGAKRPEIAGTFAFRCCTSLDLSATRSQQLQVLSTILQGCVGLKSLGLCIPNHSKVKQVMAAVPSSVADLVLKASLKGGGAGALNLQANLSRFIAFEAGVGPLEASALKLARCQNLQYLDLVGNAELGHAGLLKLELAELPSLQVLDLCGTGITDITPLKSTILQLKHLGLAGNPIGIFDLPLGASLCELELSGTAHGGWTDLSIFKTFCDLVHETGSLKRLGLRSCGLTDEHVAILQVAACPALQLLYLGSNPISEAGQRELGWHPNQWGGDETTHTRNKAGGLVTVDWWPSDAMRSYSLFNLITNPYRSLASWTQNPAKANDIVQVSNPTQTQTYRSGNDIMTTTTTTTGGSISFSTSFSVTMG